VVYPDGVVTARKTSSVQLPADLGKSIADTPTLDRRMRTTIRRTAWRDVRSVAVSDSLEIGLGTRGQRRFGRSVTISLRSGETITQFLEHRDVARIAMYAKTHLGKRVGKARGFDPLPAEHSEHQWVYWVLGAVPLGPTLALGGLVPVGAWIVARSIASPATSGRRAAIIGRVAMAIGLAAIPTILLVLGLLGVTGVLPGLAGVTGASILLTSSLIGIFVLPAAIVRLRGLWLGTACRVLDEMPPREASRPSWFDRLMASLPARARSRSLSLALRCLSVILYVGGMILLEMAEVSGAWKWAHAAACATILAIGYRCGARSAKDLRAADLRPPIVFLRSFRDDGRGTLNPQSFLIELLGLANLSSLRVFGPIASVNPVRLLRMLGGAGDDSSEEQLRNWFSRSGPFIAIGRPGEGIPTPGAGRDYVSHEEWKQRVDDWVQRSQLVVIQPGQTHGVWWEINHVLTKRRREEVLFSLVALQGRQAEYEDFALRLRERTGLRIPLFAGDAIFMRLGRASAELVRPVCRSPFRWPIAGCVVDIGRTLDREDRSIRGLWTRPDSSRALRLAFTISVILAALTWFMFSAAPGVAAHAAANSIAAGIARAELVAHPAGRQRVPVSWAGLRWLGGDALRPAGEGPFAFTRPGVFSIGGCADRCPTDIAHGEVVTRALSFVADRLGARPAAPPFDGSTQASPRGGLTWHEQMLVIANDQHPSMGPRAFVLSRVAISGDRLLCTWAMINPLAGSEDLIRSIRGVLASAMPVDWPAEGATFRIVTPSGWKRGETDLQALALLQDDHGRSVTFMAESVPDRVSGIGATELLQASITSANRDLVPTISFDGLIDTPGASATMTEIVLGFRTRPSTDGTDSRAVIARCILVDGWWLMSIAQGPAEPNVEAELLKAARALTPL
jgi:hypothetical protein